MASLSLRNIYKVYAGDVVAVSDFQVELLNGDEALIGDLQVDLLLLGSLTLLGLLALLLLVSAVGVDLLDVLQGNSRHCPSVSKIASAKSYLRSAERNR